MSNEIQEFCRSLKKHWRCEKKNGASAINGGTEKMNEGVASIKW